MMLPGHHIPDQELLDILRSSVPGRVAITSADTGIPATLAFGGQDGCACPEFEHEPLRPARLANATPTFPQQAAAVGD